MIAGFLGQIGDAIAEVVSMIVDTINAITPLFFSVTEGTSGGIASVTFTPLGILLLVGFGLGLVWTAINFIRGLVRKA